LPACLLVGLRYHRSHHSCHELVYGDVAPSGCGPLFNVFSKRIAWRLIAPIHAF
jgi:hypothetical protein